MIARIGRALIRAGEALAGAREVPVVVGYICRGEEASTFHVFGKTGPVRLLIVDDNQPLVGRDRIFEWTHRHPASSLEDFLEPPKERGSE